MQGYSVVHIIRQIESKSSFYLCSVIPSFLHSFIPLYKLISAYIDILPYPLLLSSKQTRDSTSGAALFYSASITNYPSSGGSTECIFSIFIVHISSVQYIRSLFQLGSEYLFQFRDSDTAQLPGNLLIGNFYFISLELCSMSNYQEFFIRHFTESIRPPVSLLVYQGF
jgi:hypothetical protein